MARIPVVTPDRAEGPLSEVMAHAEQQYGVVPGIVQILAADPALLAPTMQLYQHLHLAPASRLTRIQHEMVATVVNGLINGAP